MIQVRTGVFETNSSSTHSIAIPKSQPGSIPNHMWFNFGKFGWEFGEAKLSSYLYTAIYETSRTVKEAEEKVEKLKDILDTHCIEYDFERPEIEKSDDGSYFWLGNGYIDHGNELADFVNDVLDDEDKLIRFLSGGLVFTGNDNCDAEEDGFVNRETEFIDDGEYDCVNKTWVPHKIKNPYYMSDHNDYDWYYKGN